jgi:hypothetical protein
MAVLKGFMALSDDERSELLKEMGKYQNGTRPLRESFEKNIRDSTINFGPAPGGCPCCGR